MNTEQDAQSPVIKTTPRFDALNDAQKALFTTYRDELLKWNEKVNLTGITDPREVEIKHFEDSLTLLDVLPKTPLKLIDVGTGAGFPGIPLAIIRPDIEVTLVESVGKKTEFLEYIIETLGLTNCTVANARVEEVGQHIDYREKYDVAVARAVALLPVLVEYLIPLVKVGGIAIAQKSLRKDESGELTEITSAKSAISTLGGSLKKVVELSSDRALVIIEKINPTPIEYPRKPGIPAKKPLI